MKIFVAAAALAASSLVSAAPARAGESEDFAGCDGLRKPKSKDDGMRGVASVPGTGVSFGGKDTQAAGIIAACTRALTGGKLLPTQTVRQAHLLRARAAAKLRLGASADALADLDAAETAIAAQRGEVFLERSLGASLSLLRAIALVQQDKSAEAAPLADVAAERRPYAVQVQLAAAMIRETARLGDASVDPRWARLVRLNPELAANLITLETGQGRYDSAVSIARAAPLRTPTLARDAEGTEKFLALGRHGTALLDTVGAGYDLAYAMAATGDVVGARAEIAKAQASYGVLSGSSIGAAGLTPAAGGNAAASTPGGMSADRERLVEARIALAERRIADVEKLVASPLPLGAAARDLHAALYAAKGEKTVSIAPSPAMDPAAARRKAIGQLTTTAMIAHETPQSADYKKSRPNVLAAVVGAAFSLGTNLLSGIPKTQGFKETAAADGTIVVEYTGSMPSAPMVQEMTLLRAAEIAKAGGKPGFAIVAREDYSRMLTQTQYGRTLSQTPAGHKTLLTIRLLDSAETARAQGFEAAAVIDQLGPLYYEDKPRA